MTTEGELDFQVHSKINEEYENFCNWLKEQSPDVIMHHAYEYVVKADIISVIEQNDMDESRARAMLVSEVPLDDLYRQHVRNWASAEERILETIEEYTDDILEQHKANAEVEVYPHSELYAEETGEWGLYQQSTHLNIQCREAIDAAIDRYYDEAIMDSEAVQQVVAQFGVPRVHFVLANTIQAMEGDGDIPTEHKVWARSIPIFMDVDRDGQNNRNAYVLRSKPYEIITFAQQLRRDFPLKQENQKESIHKRLKVKPQKIRRSIRKISSKDQER